MRDRRSGRSPWALLALPLIAGASIATYAAVRSDADPAPPVQARAAAPVATTRADIGTLTPFYRATQEQGHLPGRGLMPIPAYLTDGSTDVGYRRNPRLKQEIPFVDSFTINRFLGGYSEKQLQQARGIWDASLGRAAGDYVVRDARGQLVSRPDIIVKHLKPYLDAGYAPSAITINLENIPWAIAAGGGSEGLYGQRNPPASAADWTLLLQKLVADLRRLYGANAPTQFKVGNEFNTLKSFNGTAQQYYALYDDAKATLGKGIAGSRIVPGEFTGNGSCPDPRQCVYDTKDLLTRAAGQRATPAYVPRSLYGIQGRPRNVMPNEAVARAVQSYRRLGSPGAEIHQFGLIGQPFASEEEGGGGSPNKRDMGVRSAAWEFLTLMELQATLHPARVFHWGGFFELPNSDVALLNGSGFIRLFLDRWLGSRIERLAVQAQPGAQSEIGAYAFRAGTRTGLIAARFTAAPSGANDAVATIALPNNLGGATWRAIVLDARSDVMQVIRRDLAAAGNLNPAFDACADCTSLPPAMARDIGQARQMLEANRAKYAQVTQRALKWAPLQTVAGAKASGSTLTLRLPPNSVVFLETGQ